METLLTLLIDNLNNQIELHRELLECLNQEAQSIGSVSGAELLKIQSAKLGLVRKLGTMEEERVGLVKKVLSAQGLPASGITLFDLTQSVEEPFRTRLRLCRQQLKEVMEAIDTVGKRNARLAEARLKPINSSLQFLQDLQREKGTYSVRGNLSGPPTKLKRASV